MVTSMSTVLLLPHSVRTYIFLVKKSNYNYHVSSFDLQGVMRPIIATRRSTFSLWERIVYDACSEGSRRICSEGGCVNSILYLTPKYGHGQGGRGGTELPKLFRSHGSIGPCEMCLALSNPFLFQQMCIIDCA